MCRHRLTLLVAALSLLLGGPLAASPPAAGKLITRPPSLIRAGDQATREALLTPVM